MAKKEKDPVDTDGNPLDIEFRAQSGHNLTEVRDAIVDACDKIDQHEKDRQASNDEIKALRERLVAKGIPKKALDVARQYLKLS